MILRNLSASWNSSLACPFNKVRAIVIHWDPVLRGAFVTYDVFPFHMAASIASQSSATPSANSRIFFVYAGSGTVLCFVRRVNFKCHSFIVLIFSDGFLCLFRFFEWNQWRVHGGISMASGLQSFGKFTTMGLSGLKSMAPSRNESTCDASLLSTNAWKQMQ